MKRFVRPCGANSDEDGPLKRYQGGNEHDKIGPVSKPIRLEGGRGVGGFRDPFIVEAEGNGKDDYRCEVEREDGDVEAGGDDAAAAREARI